MNKELREDLEHLIICKDKTITQDLRDDIKMTLDYIDKLEKRINKVKTYIEQYEIIHKGLSYEEERILDILGGNYDDTL